MKSANSSMKLGDKRYLGDNPLRYEEGEAAFPTTSPSMLEECPNIKKSNERIMAGTVKYYAQIRQRVMKGVDQPVG